MHDYRRYCEGQSRLESSSYGQGGISHEKRANSPCFAHRGNGKSHAYQIQPASNSPKAPLLRPQARPARRYVAMNGATAPLDAARVITSNPPAIENRSYELITVAASYRVAAITRILLPSSSSSYSSIGRFFSTSSTSAPRATRPEMYRRCRKSIVCVTYAVDFRYIASKCHGFSALSRCVTREPPSFFSVQSLLPFSLHAPPYRATFFSLAI